MKTFHKKLKTVILTNKNFNASYLRGIIAAEGQIALKKWGTISFIAISSESISEIEWYKLCLSRLGISSGKYQPSTRKFPIYNRKNLTLVNSFKLCDIHPNKRQTFAFGFSRYSRNVESSDDVIFRIMTLLTTSSKTYDEISQPLGKSRSVIQSHYIPILEKRGLIECAGKKKQALLFQITKNGINFLNNS